MSMEWIAAGGPQGKVWREWLGRNSPLLAQRLGAHPAAWLASGAAATAPANLAWLKAFAPARKRALAERIGAALRVELNGDPPPAMQTALQTLAQPNSALVITGQQPGLWGGPCLTLWKALSAVAAARRLNDPARRPAWAADFQFVPAFWVAGEDADVAEAARGWTWNAQAGIQAFQFADHSAWSNGNTAALNDLPLGPAALAINQLTAALDPGENLPAVQALLESYSDPELTFSRAFVRLLAQVLGPLGVVLIESRMLAGDNERDRWVLKGISEQATVAAALCDGAQTLAAQGYEVGFPEQSIDRGPFIFLSDAAGADGCLCGCRRRLVGAAAPFGLHQQDGAPLSLVALQDCLKTAPERFTFGAPLRVLVQNAALPTAAVVLGPGELGYWAQLRELSDRLQAPWPALLPRVSATALLPRHSRILRKFGIGLEPFLSEPFDPNKVLPPPANLQPWLERQKQLLDDLKAWFEQGGALAKNEQKLQEKTAQKLEYEIDKFSGRVARAAAESATGEASAVQNLRQFVHPHGPQERSLIWPVLLNARGVDLPAQWVEELQVWIDSGDKFLQHAVLHL